MNTIYEKNVAFALFWMAIGMFYNDDASKRYLGSYFDYFVSALSDIGFFAVVKKKNKEAVLCFFLET